MHLRRWSTATLLIGLGLALTGCETGIGAQPITSTSPTATAIAQPTAGSENPSPTAVVSAQQCNPEADDVHIGDLAISRPSVLYGFNADYMLPEGISTTKPLTVTLQSGGPYVLGINYKNQPVVRPGDFIISVCNTSTTNIHHLTNLGVIMTSLTPYSGQLNTLNGCALLYGRPTDRGGECASGYAPDLEKEFQFPANAASQATVTQPLPQPMDLSPGQSLGISIGIQPPTTIAITTYRLGVGIDGQPITYPAALSTQPSINAPIARRWAGNYCGTAQMQSQIPATTPANTYYVCPQV